MQRSASLRSFNDPIYASRNVYESHNPQHSQHSQHPQQAHNPQHGVGHGHHHDRHGHQGQPDPRQIYGHHVPRNNSQIKSGCGKKVNFEFATRHFTYKL